MLLDQPAAFSDTAEFSVSANRHWWQETGRQRYPKAKRWACQESMRHLKDSARTTFIVRRYRSTTGRIEREIFAIDRRRWWNFS
ncbi:MAG: hypothetical protein KDB01_05900 [Planctomycetaceae bacterium]|nr:hypothetical protein [Planctomycetaceae bacterium]